MSNVRSSDSVVAAIKKLEEFLRLQERVPDQVMQSFANELQEEIRRETPVKTGALENSVYVNVNKLGRHRTTLAAGANAFKKGYNYSAIQHESPGFHHPIKGKAYYVKDPFERTTAKLIEALKQGIQYPK